MTFEGNGITLIFYDKKAEIKACRDAKKYYSSFLQDKNVIRYELKLTKRLEKHLKLPKDKLYVKDLYSTNAYKQLVRLWYKKYQMVKKNMFYREPFEYDKFGDYLKNEGIERLGGVRNTLKVIDCWVAKKGFDRKKKSYEKKQVKDNYNKLSSSNNLIKELNRKIKFEKEFYL